LVAGRGFDTTFGLGVPFNSYVFSCVTTWQVGCIL